MVDDETATDPLLNEDDAVVASLLGLRMMAADIAVGRAASGRPAKIEVHDAAVERLAEELATSPAEGPRWRLELAARLATASTRDRQSVLLHRAAQGAAGHVPSRSRQLAVLIELVLFDPWPAGVCAWADKAHRRTLTTIVDEFEALEAADLDTVEDERTSAERRLRRRQQSTPVRRARAVAVGVVGVGLGVATMGAAAPVIGAALGASALGLSGAAATSAGLAMLGGGALTTGGFGMAGGTALLAGAGGLAGAGLFAGGARAASLRWGGVALQAIRLELHTVVVTLGEDRDDEQARRVAVLLRRRLDDVTIRLIDIATRLAEEREKNSELRQDLEAERDRATMAESALNWALEQLAEAGIDTSREILDLDSERTRPAEAAHASETEDAADPLDDGTCS